MKRFLLTTLGFTFILIIGHLILFAGQLGVKTEKTRWIHEALELKEQKANSIIGRKILIISGSNALFSLSAKQIEEQLEIPTINCGIHAGLKLEYILERYINLVNENDIVILPLEYASYSYDGSTSETLANFISARDPEWLKGKPLKMILNTAFSFSLADLLKRNFKRFRADEQTIGYYDASYISTHGDKENISPDLMTEKDYFAVKTSKPKKIKFTEHSLSRHILGEFLTQCKNRKATVLLTFPTTIQFEAYNTDVFFNQIKEIRDFTEKEGGIVIGEPSTFHLPIECFFNTSYHANLIGRETSTRRLIDLLEEHIRQTPTEKLELHTTNTTQSSTVE